MKILWGALVGLCCGWLVACSGGEAITAPIAETATAAASVTAAPSADAPKFAKPGDEFLCGAFICKAFATPEAAFKHVIETTKPLVLALGESHAQKGAPNVPSTTARFTEQLLPVLEGTASSLVLELWVADGKCNKATEKKVAEQQKEVTKTQAEGNTNEFVKLGEKSKSLGIVPFILRPSCDEYETIKKAGDNAVLEMLAMITRNMKAKVESLFKETEKKSPGKMVVTYGGAMHNDIAPVAGREDWSYAADLDKLAKGRYVELDLVVPEYIKDNDSWRKLPWYGSYEQPRFAGSVVLIKVAPKSYAMVFARSTTP
jgi:hypothetical protein